MVRFFKAAVIASVLSMPPAVVAAGNGSQPGSEPKIERGHHIANTVCSACHVVGADQDLTPILRDHAPDFRVIAKRPDVTVDSLTTFLRTTHRTEGKPYTMPAPLLTDEMIDDVASYILSLRNQR